MITTLKCTSCQLILYDLYKKDSYKTNFEILPLLYARSKLKHGGNEP